MTSRCEWAASGGAGGECDLVTELKAELASERTVLQAWHSIFGTTQLSHAQARLEAAEQKVTPLETDLAAMAAERDMFRAHCEDALHELADLKRPCKDVEEQVWRGHCGDGDWGQVVYADFARRLAAQLRAAQEESATKSALIDERDRAIRGLREEFAGARDLVKLGRIKNELMVSELEINLASETEARNALEGERTELQAKIGHLEQQLAAKSAPPAPGGGGYAQPCCGEFAICNRACTPRGRWQAEQEAKSAAPDQHCTCGQPNLSGIRHRLNGPCYRFATEASPEQAAPEPVPCRHEWYQGACAHCLLPADKYRAALKTAPAPSVTEEQLDDVARRFYNLSVDVTDRGLAIIKNACREVLALAGVRVK